MRWTDILGTVAPIGLSLIPGIGIPAAIAASAALKGGMTAAEGGSAGEILRDVGLGAATGAAGAGTAAGIGKLLGKGAEAATTAGGKAATKAFEKAGDIGFGEASKQAMQALSRAGTAEKVLGGAAQVFTPDMGENAKVTASMLETLQKGGKVIGAADQAVKTVQQMQTPRFSQQHMAMSQMEDPMRRFTSFGGLGSGTQTVGFGQNRFSPYGGYF